MRSFGFLLSRRWALFAVAVALAAYAAWWLGEWQFGRLDDRKADNAVIRTNESLAPAPVDDVLAVGEQPSHEDEWRLVTATGTYDESSSVVVRYRTRDGAQGVDVVVPLVTADGTALLVDRGFLATDSSGVDRADLPSPPSGEVEVTGWVRADGTGDSTRVDGLSTRAISSREIGPAIDRDVFGGFVDLQAEDGAPAAGLDPVELPELNNGPHFFYGLQWWFFGVLAVFGFFYLLYDEWRGGPRSERAPKPGSPTRPPKPPKKRSRSRIQADAIRAQLEREKAEKEARKAAERERERTGG
ncbi:SURF1 family cytochrome oxidase biogenesis protein [Nocardioides flavescens]|uniref:SURF1-like protein n=1 Tax=Nocardioides flavescens TaxID=2691959 RepID=A0A6L7EYZ6_9ACTN|nr:SURF1 family protein [Nocardioides flavescens]